MESRGPIGDGASAGRDVGPAERDNRVGDNSPVGGIALSWPDLITQALAVAETSVAKDGALTELIAKTGHFCSASGGAIYLYSATRELKHEAGYGLSSDLTTQLEHLSQPYAARRLLTVQDPPLLIEDVRGTAASDPGRAGVLELLAREGVASVASFPLVASGSLLGFLTLYHNTRRAYGREEIENLSLLAGVLALALLNKRLSDIRKVADKGRDHFISALSHELRTPLTSILGFTQMIRRKLASAPPGGGRMAEQMDIIWGQAQRLNRLIDTFVDIANIEQGDFTIKFGRVELLTVLKSAVEQTVARLNPACKLEISLPGGPLWVRGDTQRLEQLFNHVISNALRYSPSDLPVTIECVVNSLEGIVQVSVTDQGPGLPSDMRGAIFERFSQADALRSGGLGVGLYLSKTIVEAHGGQIGVDSGPGKGTSVSITLPL